MPTIRKATVPIKKIAQVNQRMTLKRTYTDAD